MGGEEEQGRVWEGDWCGSEEVGETGEETGEETGVGETTAWGRMGDRCGRQV